MTAGLISWVAAADTCDMRIEDLPDSIDGINAAQQAERAVRGRERRRRAGGLLGLVLWWEWPLWLPYPTWRRSSGPTYSEVSQAQRERDRSRR